MKNIKSGEKISFDIFAINFYIFIIAFEAPIRMVLITVHLDFLVYIRDVFLLLIIIKYIYTCSQTMKINVYPLCVCVIVIFYLSIGWYFTENIVQVIVGFRTLLPFIAGSIVWRQYIYALPHMHMFFKIIFWGTCAGIVIDYVCGGMPWSGMNYEVAGQSVEGVREWSIGTIDIRRPTGFFRLSTTTAIVLTYVTLIKWYIQADKTFILTYISAFLGIIITTQKTSIIVFILMGIIFSIKKVHKSCMIITSLLIIILLALPLYSATIADMSFNYSSDLSTLIFINITARVMNSWPGIFDIVSNYGTFLFGRGIGGIGYQVAMFDKVIPSTELSYCDNFIVYIYGLTGMVGVITISCLIFKTWWKLNQKNDNRTNFIILLFISFLGNAVMQDMQDAISLIILSFILGYSLHITKGRINENTN